MLDFAFEDWDDMRERESADAAAERAEGLHDFDPLFTLRIPREQAVTRPVLKPAKPPVSLAPGVTRKPEEERAA